MAAQDVAVATWDVNEVVPLVANRAWGKNIKLKPSVTYAKGQILGPVTATPGQYAIYASGNADGSQVAECILPRAVVTDASGNIFYGAQASSEHGDSPPTIPAWFGGVFLASELTGLDTNAVTKLVGKLSLAGTVLSF